YVQPKSAGLLNSLKIFALLGFKGACGIWGGEEERREEHARGDWEESDKILC
ncbi:hypothetical protein SCLCIDRAFT_1222833, partial [Scleroderma citrinum Foug A]